MANDVFFGIGVAGDSAVFTRSDEGYFFVGRAGVPILHNAIDLGSRSRRDSTTRQLHPADAGESCRMNRMRRAAQRRREP